MTADDFVKILRHGSEKLRVDDVVLNTGTTELRGKGMLRITQEEIEVDLTLDEGQDLPEVRTGVHTKSDFWKLTGVIEDHLHFQCVHVGPGGSSRSFNGRHTLTRHLHPIDIVPSGLDAMTREERARVFANLRKAAGASHSDDKKLETDLSDGSQPYLPVAQFHAVLANYPVMFLDTGTTAIENNAFLGETSSSKLDTCSGEIDGFDFGLIKKGDDLHIHLESTKVYTSSGESEDWRSFSAFLKALAFVHGVHAWPYRTVYWRDGRKITDRITAAARLPQTPYAPFSRALAFNAQIGANESGFRDILRKTSAFFNAESELTAEVSELLFLFREAGDRGVHGDITLIALCILFENLVRLLFQYLHLEEKLNDEDSSKLFLEARQDVCDYVSRKVDLSKQLQGSGRGYTRLLGLVQSAAPFHMREMFKAVTDHFGLKWEGDMEIVFKTWKDARNPLIHVKKRANRPEQEVKDTMMDDSRIAGAINILLLKLFGYSGLMRASTFEEKYRHV